MREVKVNVDGKIFDVQVLGEKLLIVNGKPYEYENRTLDKKLQSLNLNGKTFESIIHETEHNQFSILLNNKIIASEIVDKLQYLLNNSENKSSLKKIIFINAPMPGLVSKVMVSEGEKITNGMKLLVLEAMKMENDLRSNHTGTIKKIYSKERTTVEKGEKLIEIEQ